LNIVLLQELARREFVQLLDTFMKDAIPYSHVVAYGLQMGDSLVTVEGDMGSYSFPVRMNKAPAVGFMYVDKACIVLTCCRAHMLLC
jgi:hypothetical protein